MPDCVETMTYFGSVPWHGLGTPIPQADRYDLAKSRDLAGLNWSVSVEPLFLQNQVEVDQAKAIVRDTDKRVLGVVGPRYTPLQNQDAFDWFQPMFDAKLCAINTAGSLQQGEKVWILAEIMGKAMEIAPNDSVARFLMISNSHNGTTSVRVGFTPVRVVCANTLAMAHSSAASKLIRLRHHKEVKANLDKIRDVINLANQEFEATAEQYRFLASKRIAHPDDLRLYVRLAAGVDPSVKEEDVPTRTKNIMIEMLEKCVNGIGQNNPAIAGTWWSAYNGVNQYLNYDKGRTASNRLDNLWFGTGVNDNLKLLKGAVAAAAGRVADMFKS